MSGAGKPTPSGCGAGPHQLQRSQRVEGAVILESWFVHLGYLFIDGLHCLGVIPIARSGARRQDRVDLLELSGVRRTSSAPRLSSRYLARFVPGIGTMSSPCARTHARASWLGVQPLAAASCSIFLTRSRFFWKFSPWKRGALRRKSSAGQVVERLELPGQEPAAQRAVGDEPDAQLPHGREDLVLRLAAPERILRLQRRDRVDLRRPADRRRRTPPTARGSRTFPAFTSSAIAPTVSSIGVFGIDAVLVVQVDHVQRRAAGGWRRSTP